MKPKNAGIDSLENLVPSRAPSTPSVAGAPSRRGGAGQVGRLGPMQTDPGFPPSEAALQRYAEPSSTPGGIPREAPEYEELDEQDLIYDRTGTLCFPYPSRKAESGVRAIEAGGARPEAIGRRSREAESTASFPLERRASASNLAPLVTPGVAKLATINIAGGQGASTVARREPPMPPSAAKANASGPAATSTSRALLAPSVPQRVAVGPVFPPARRGSPVANRAFNKVAHTFVAPPSSSAARHTGSSRAREGRPLAPASNGERTTQPRIRTRQPVPQCYPSFGQRVLAEVQRIPLAKWSVALGALAAVVVVGMFVASSTLMPRRNLRARGVPRSSAAAVVDGRTPAPAHVAPRVSVISPEPASEPPETLERPAVDAPLVDDRSKRAKATAHANPRAPRGPTPHEPCECFEGDPLCGCLD